MTPWAGSIAAAGVRVMALAVEALAGTRMVPRVTPVRPASAPEAYRLAVQVPPSTFRSANRTSVRALLPPAVSLKVCADLVAATALVPSPQSTRADQAPT